MARSAPRRRTPVDQIEDLILDLELRPGDPMPTEAALCEQLGISRSSVREAIRTLQSLDIVEVRHGHGTYVGQLSLSPLVSGLIFRSVLNTDQSFRTLRDVVSLRIALDLGVADEVCRVHGGHPDPTLRALVADMRTRTAAGLPFPESDGAFHSRLLSAVDNVLVRELAAAFWEVHTKVVPLLGFPPNTEIEHTVEAHDAILDALEAGDVDAYRAAVLDHYGPLTRAIDAASASTPAPAPASTPAPASASAPASAPTPAPAALG